MEPWVYFPILTLLQTGGGNEWMLTISLAELLVGCMLLFPNICLVLRRGKRMWEYSFVLSPYGNGFDCHRTWEALCLGSIPIMKAPHFRLLFQDLPVLNVSDWDEINEDLLRKTLDVFKQRQFNYEKLKLSYWTAQISPK